jgi:2-amino-4-hydroxy-6-hydroxymethyldihydropteridine diphosphokinase
MSVKTNHRTIIALGSNLGDSRAIFARALSEIEKQIGEILARSEWRETTPLLHPENPTEGQANYLNAVIMVSTALAPDAMLSKLHTIERMGGRRREMELLPWSPRELDLDIIAYDALISPDPRLTLPHPQMHKRRFVLAPLCEICPEWVHPLLERTARELLTDLPADAV